MSVVAIFGAGELGGALASKLAARARVREIRLIDPAAGVAAGKALDILQAGPIELSTVSLTAPADDAAALRAVADAAVIVLADHVGTPGKPPVEIQGEAGLTLLRRVRAANARAPIVCAGAQQAWLIAHAAAELGIAGTQIVGSAPHALASALRALVALELNGSAHDISLILAGTPPDGIIVPWHAASSQGSTLETLLDAGTLRRLESKIHYLWPPGPYVLAAAAARFVEALLEGSPRTFVGFVDPSASAAGAAAPGSASSAAFASGGMSPTSFASAPASGPAGNAVGARRSMSTASGSAASGPTGSAIALPIRFDSLGRARVLDLPALSAMQRSTLDALLPR